MSLDTSLADMMIQAGGSIRRVIEVSRDYRVLAYDAAAQTADLQAWVNDPELNQATGEINGTVIPVLRGVPVRWPSAGGRALTWGLSVGDRVVGVVRTVSHDEADAGAAAPVTPASLRRWSLADCWCYPSGVTRTEAAPGARTDGAPALALPAGEAFHVGGGTPEHFVTRDDLLVNNLNAIKAALDTIAAAAGVANSYVRTATRSDRLKVDG